MALLMTEVLAMRRAIHVVPAYVHVRRMRKLLRRLARRLSRRRGLGARLTEVAADAALLYLARVTGRVHAAINWCNGQGRATIPEHALATIVDYTCIQAVRVISRHLAETRDTNKENRH